MLRPRERWRLAQGFRRFYEKAAFSFNFYLWLVYVFNDFIILDQYLETFSNWRAV